jgi:hypothetical protein
VRQTNELPRQVFATIALVLGEAKESDDQIVRPDFRREGTQVGGGIVAGGALRDFRPLYTAPFSRNIPY